MPRHVSGTFHVRIDLFPVDKSNVPSEASDGPCGEVMPVSRLQRKPRFASNTNRFGCSTGPVGIHVTNRLPSRSTAARAPAATKPAGTDVARIAPFVGSRRTTRDPGAYE